MRKKWLFMLLLCMLFLTACNIQSVEQFEEQEEKFQSIDTTVEEKQKEVEDVEIKQSIVSELEEKQEEAQTPLRAHVEKEEKEAEQKEEQSNSPPAEAITPEKNNKKSLETTKEVVTKETVPAKKEEQTLTQNTENVQQKKTTAPIPQEAPKKYVSIAIRVDSLLNHKDLLDPSLDNTQFVPENGVVLSTTKYELIENESVFDLLVRTTREHNIHMEYQGANDNAFGTVYIEGINHLYEFSAGPLSGWMFSVNGTYPNYGASKVILKDGDHVEWNYTVDLGRDLGAERSE